MKTFKSFLEHIEKLSNGQYRLVSKHRDKKGHHKNLGTYPTKAGAEKRGIPFNLTKEEFISLLYLPCYYDGTVNSNVWTNQITGEEFTYNGIDRIDNTMGYTLDNCVSCCWRCNNGKKDDSQTDFLSWISQVYHFFIESKE